MYTRWDLGDEFEDWESGTFLKGSGNEIVFDTEKPAILPRAADITRNHS